MNPIDSLVSYFNPIAGLKRTQARAHASHIRAYDAAGKGRRLKNWKAPATSQNAEMVWALSDLRNRARDLGRNNPYAKKAVDILTTNTIGTGIMPTPVNKSKKIADAAKDAWQLWANSTKCDFNEQTNFYGLQDMATRAMFADGEVIIRKYRRNNGAGIVPVCLQILESDFLDHNKTMPTNGGGYIIQGVEFNKEGRRIAYWLFDSHPGDVLGMRNAVSVSVPAKDIIHLYDVHRPGQVRGIPEGVSAFVRMRDLDLYADAQLVRQQIAACYVAFIQDSTESFTGSTQEYEGATRFEPGQIEILPPGKSITFGTPPAAEGYESYTRTVLREIACAYNITYEALTGDYSNVNFSSARMGYMEFGRRIDRVQELVLIPRFLTRIWDWFNEGCAVAGILRKPIASTWTCPRRQAVDPMKEVAALKEMVRAGFISYSEAVRQGGYIPEEVIKEIAEDNKKFDDNKFMLTIDARNDPQRSDIYPIPNKDEQDTTTGIKEDKNGFAKPK